MRIFQVAMAAIAAIGFSNNAHFGSTSTRLGVSEASLMRLPQPYSGLLIDAGCSDRTALNLSIPPEPLSSAIPAAPGASSTSPAGITVAPQTLAGERQDIVPHQVPDILTRQNDPTCAVTGSTSAFALLLANGQLVNLDPGGNTFAWQAIQSSEPGRALLNGQGPGLKPAAEMVGFLSGSTLVVQGPITVERPTT